MNATKRHKPEPGKSTSTQRPASAFLPLLVASASAATLIATPADALELGELRVESTLGQPLRASVAYALNPSEELYDFCVSLTKGPAVNGLPAVTRAKIGIANNRILINGSVPIKEPLLAMRLTVDCPYTAHISRQFTLMLDPQETPTAAGDPVVTAPVANDSPGVETARIAPHAADRSGVGNASPIGGASYRVKVGDTLSGIASRIENRPVGLWRAVQEIFDANPAAFIDGDINRLTAGAMLTIPFLEEGAVVSQAATTDRQSATPAASTSNTSAYNGLSALAEPTPAAQAAAEAPDTSGPMSTAPAPDPEPYVEPAIEVADDTAVLSAGAERATEVVAADANKVSDAQPGDVFVGADIPADAEIEAQRPPAVVAAPAQEPAGTPSWLFWALGAGLAVVAGLLAFGAGLRGRFGGGAGMQAVPARRATDNDETARNKVLGDVDFQFDDPLPGDVDMVLDADLGAGTGLQEGDELDVAQDFGFSANADDSGELDMLLPEQSSGDTQAGPTDIIPPQASDRSSILEQEVLPDEDDEGEYDLSMIVDATRQKMADTDSTAKELNAVIVSAQPPADSTANELHQDIELKVLEQDYEDELTATQALNMEIEKAAMELASRMDDELTAEMPAKIGSDPDSEPTAEMLMAAAENDDVVGDLDDTGVNEELTANMQIGDESGTSEQLTVDFNLDDATVEMDLESDTVDTKKLAR